MKESYLYVALFASIALFIFLALSGCAPLQPTAGITRSGILLQDYSDRVDPEYVEQTAQCMAKTYNINPNTLQRLTITIKTGFVVDCMGEFVNGCYFTKLNMIYVAIHSNNPEGWRGTLRHELKHWVLEQKGFVNLPDSHDDPIFDNDGDC